MSYISQTLSDLEKEHNAAIHTAQEKMLTELNDAQASGNFEKIQEASLVFQNITTELAEEYIKRIEEINAMNHKVVADQEPQIYTTNRADINLNLLVYDGDRDYVIEFQKDDLIQDTLKKVTENNGKFKSRKHLLKSSLRLTKTLAPTLHEIGAHCKKTLKLKADIEFFVYQSDIFNASCYPPDDNKLYIILSSGIIERFSKEELTFVVGHEIGHVLFEHFDYPVRQILEQGENDLAPIHAMKLYAWNRNAEISADRAGLLCCQNFEAVGRTFFKLSSGVTTDSLDFKLNDYIEQFVDLEKVLNDTDHDPSDWYSSHPFSPLRIKALELFNKSETYAKFNETITGEITEEAMEVEIKRIMSLMEPENLESNSEHSEKLQRLMFLGGYLISNADGIVDDSEIQALSSIVSPKIFANCMMTIKGLTEQEMISEVQQLAKDLDIVLSVMQKLNILRDLSIISYADGHIDDSEVNVLYNLARLLYINTDFIDRVISDAQGV
ncbi:M48 family metalloprotease [Cellulophaga sp. E16_2]|uniref:Peptidase M48 Ste24p n=1 Tax=Cellulophaga algicola (strain DSM 14237 / IC166 / ACAM 630) TaxID=688270 RepID=E6X5D4_CELAD|nr:MULTISPECIES: M48 family metallopeptidase [Cellulophaga]ADV50489.1 peptidase M48 Ste24p [Cellulophaga algicola DSM 14237]MBO0592898.1 M48 family metalloprotease [Cellulophaga sp. E16_2]